MLAVSSEMPWPLTSGGHLRTFHLLRSIAKRFRVHLLVPALSGDTEGTSALAREGIRAEAVPTTARGPLVDALNASRCAASGRAYVMYGRHVHESVRRRAREVIADLSPAVLYLDHLDGFGYGLRPERSVVALDLHNVYSLIAERLAQEQSGLRRAYLRREARLLKRAERSAAAGVDVLFAVSRQEVAYYETLGGPNVHLVPNGVDCAAYASLPDGRVRGDLIVYVGSMSWPPNEEAALFLATTVLPQVRRQRPNARLRIVGKSPGAELRALDGRDGIEVTGEVPDVIPHLEEAALLAVALESGGGTRLKILEALAAGLPVVSTPVGAEGLDLEAGVHLVIEERARFADAITGVLTDRATGTRIARSGRALVRRVYDWSAIGASAADALSAAVRG